MTNDAVRTSHIFDTDRLYRDIHNGALPAFSLVKPSGWWTATPPPRNGAFIPLIVVSPWTKPGHISHNYPDHDSILKFIQHNWHLPTISDRSRDNLADPTYDTAVSDLVSLQQRCCQPGNRACCPSRAGAAAHHEIGMAAAIVVDSPVKGALAEFW
jgi:Phosphoesterase family